MSPEQEVRTKYAVAKPAVNDNIAIVRCAKLMVTGPNFTKFLLAIEGSSAVLTRASTLRSLHPLLHYITLELFRVA